MGSLCELKLYCSNESDLSKISALIIKRINHFEDKYTRFKPTSITSKINKHAGLNQRIVIDSETAHLLNYANVLFNQSDGFFDITSGVLRQAWNFKSNTLPNNNKIVSLLNLIGWENVEWSNDFIRLPVKGMEIDFGGFVKEYVADIIVTLCLENNIFHGLINLGGDIRVIGPHPDGSPWRVGIQHPRKPKQPIAWVDISRGGIATSGDYERYMMVNNKRYSHLLNPNTGQSIQPQFASVSVIANSCLLAGSFSTIAMLKSEESPQWIQKIGLPFLSVDLSMNISGTISCENVVS